ncbi:hypothetical protein WMY93_014026 [Mugilogobius chulae]|uniref:Uncharacterized protein n=1 Tax=Mugilogobius chulae TaxID=88201 RepID=A0AAW0P4E1_9GOBI
MNRSCIVAFDFGTAYSGYAFSLTLNESEVVRVKLWEQRKGVETSKAPTCVLFDEDQSFVEFGYKARDRYYEISKTSNNYYYFKDFKMELYNKEITKDLEIRDVNRRSMNALKVFSAALRFLKEDALETIDKEPNIPKGLWDFTWVLTVPAIWDEPARQFMRKAAVQVNITPGSHCLQSNSGAATGPVLLRWVTHISYGGLQSCCSHRLCCRPRETPNSRRFTLNVGDYATAEHFFFSLSLFR